MMTQEQQIEAADILTLGLIETRTEEYAEAVLRMVCFAGVHPEAFAQLLQAFATNLLENGNDMHRLADEELKQWQIVVRLVEAGKKDRMRVGWDIMSEIVADAQKKV